LLGAGFMLTRSLLFCAALHMAWNFFQSTVLGAATSGHAAGYSLIEAKISGPSWLTGGHFGPEASVQAVALGAALAAWLLWQARRRGHWLTYKIARLALSRAWHAETS
jgi:uncharacterized protein